ncbi:6-phosphogluconate dehydrogenase C-terminal domain-like protein [Thozetella sp. PMI_491]|nr:6-phosphogluconate dehydrogenase C-terminal domain-like protein [Thozetella sp. PMI_491]
MSVVGTDSKARVLLIGSGGVGTIAAVNLEAGGLASVVAVLRSNYQVVKERGFSITSVDHGTLIGWRPTKIVNSVPDIERDAAPPYDFVVLTTKNIPDITPTALDVTRCAITPGHTVIVLIQNGLNIERPFFAAFPKNVVLSGVSIIGSREVTPGVIEQDSHDSLTIGPFPNPNLAPGVEEAATKRFIQVYNAAGKSTCTYETRVGWARWRKLVYNACLNPLCAITGLDTGRIRLSDGTVDGLVKPAMEEIRSAAVAAGHILPEDIAQTMIELDPLQMYFAPSMLDDFRKGNYIEYENIIGEPMRVGKELGVPMPTITTIYFLCEAIQWRIKEAKGLIKVPPKELCEV